MKGLLLAGGRGSRLSPLTPTVSKHLLPVYDKPLVYYSLSNLMLAQVREVQVICNPTDVDSYRELLKDGKSLGMTISFEIQTEPLGIPDALRIAESWLNGSGCVLALGDNVFFGSGLPGFFKEISSEERGASVLLKSVPDPERFGSPIFDKDGNLKSIVEKPTFPETSFAVTGYYFLDSEAVRLSQTLSPSERGELEMADLLNLYGQRNSLTGRRLPRGTFWMDAGTTEAMHAASVFVRSVQLHTGNLVGSPHEIAWRNGWITSDQLLDEIEGQASEYHSMLRRVLRQEGFRA